jgi:hypothetical protein
VTAVIRHGDLTRTAMWVREHGGSCTAPSAVEFGFEDEFRVKTTTGATAVQSGDYIVCGDFGDFYVLSPDEIEGSDQ